MGTGFCTPKMLYPCYIQQQSDMWMLLPTGVGGMRRWYSYKGGQQH